MVKLEVFRCSKIARLPERKTDGSAGYDLYSSEDVVILRGERKLVGTGIKVSFPSNHYIRIAPRSGLSAKGIDIGAGVIDSDYTGEIKVLVINNGDDVYISSLGDRIAQMILTRISTPKVVEVDSLQTTVRGSGGFGSTGK